MENEMGKRIKLKRLEANLTMEELGTKLGVQKSAINKWEKGMVTNIKRSTIQAMAEIFDCSPIWLMGWDDEPITIDFSQPEHKTNLISEDNEYIQMYRELNQEDKNMINKMIKTLYSTRSEQ